MSTFNGVVEEYPLISIDRFSEENNYASTVYFLSHCHKDHMYGLNDENFFHLLCSRGFSKIYLSDVSSHLLKCDEKYQHLSDYLVEIRIEQPTLINVYDEKGIVDSTVTVTLLTAGHCPGSVMFLIEGDNGNVLYTGDFRLPVGSAKRLKHLHEISGSLKPLRSLYIDTTFCNENCWWIPSREECLNEIVLLVEPWLSKGPNYIAFILCPYELAYEFVFVELYKRYGVKTHVTEELEKKYTGIKLIENAITSCASEARIHACILDRNNHSCVYIRNFYEYQTPCGFVSSNEKPVHVIKIKPSAMFFTRNEFPSISHHMPKINFHRVFYSTHPSLSEIQDMVSYLKPKRVFPNVVSKQTVEEILELIFRPDEIVSDENTSGRCSMPPLGKLKNPSPKDTSSQDNGSLPFFDDCYSIKCKKSDTCPPIRTLSSRPREILEFHTDFENTAEQEAMLREEICLQKIGHGNCSDMNISSLKWMNPVISSDEEIFGSSDSSSKDKDDSDIIGGTSEENNIKSSNEGNEQDNIKTTYISGPASESPKSSASESLINETYLKHFFSTKYSKANSLSFVDENSLRIDMEYSKISEVDNGICITKSENTDRNVPSYSCNDSLVIGGKMQIIASNSKIKSSCSSKYQNIDFAYSDNVHSELEFNKASTKYNKRENSSTESVENNFKFSGTIDNAQNNIKKAQHVAVKSNIMAESGLNSEKSAKSYGHNSKSICSVNETNFFPDSENCINEVLKPYSMGKKVTNVVSHFNSKCNGDDRNIYLKQPNDSLHNNSVLNPVLKCEYETANKPAPFSDFKSPTFERCASEAGEKSETKKHGPKSFHFVKKIDSSSDSEDEYTFKYVVKLHTKDGTNNEKLKVSNSNEMKSNLCNSLAENEKSRKNLLDTGKSSNVRELYAAKDPSIESEFNKKNTVKTIRYAQDKELDKRNVIFSNKRESMCNDKYENQSECNGKLSDDESKSDFQINCHSNCSSSVNSFLHKTSNKKNDRFTFKISNNYLSKQNESLFAVQNAENVKVHQNNSLSPNKNSDAEITELPFDFCRQVYPQITSNYKNVHDAENICIPSTPDTENRTNFPNSKYISNDFSPKLSKFCNQIIEKCTFNSSNFPPQSKQSVSPVTVQKVKNSTEEHQNNSLNLSKSKNSDVENVKMLYNNWKEEIANPQIKSASDVKNACFPSTSLTENRINSTATVKNAENSIEISQNKSSNAIKNSDVEIVAISSDHCKEKMPIKGPHTEDICVPNASHTEDKKSHLDNISSTDLFSNLNVCKACNQNTGESTFKNSNFSFHSETNLAAIKKTENLVKMPKKNFSNTSKNLNVDIIDMSTDNCRGEMSIANTQTTSKYANTQITSKYTNTSIIKKTCVQSTSHVKNKTNLHINDNSSTADSFPNLNSTKSCSQSIGKSNFKSSSFSFHSEPDLASTAFKKTESSLKKPLKCSFDPNKNKISDCEIINVSSDHTNVEMLLPNAQIMFKYKNVPNVKNSNSPSTSHAENKNLALNSNQGDTKGSIPSTKVTFETKDNKMLSNIGNISKMQKTDIKYISESKSTDSVNKLNVVQSNDKECIGCDDSPEIIFDHKVDNQSMLFQNQVQEQNCIMWEIKSVSQSSSSSSVIVEEILSSSDLDDSPSLIAPIIPRTLHNNSSSMTNSFNTCKRRKIDFKASASLGRSEDCDKTNKVICDNYLFDSDSTPELLENNLLSSKEISEKIPIPEIIIDDDDDD